MFFFRRGGSAGVVFLFLLRLLTQNRRLVLGLCSGAAARSILT
jgi:hypothetical protein